MKVIGLIGGVGWPSTIEYYRLMNQEAQAAVGSSHSAEVLLHSYDYATISALMHQGNWEKLAAILIETAKQLETAGAEVLVIACNTLHKVAREVRAGIGIPLLHIAEAAAEEAARLNLKTVGLLGSGFVMEQDFYKEPFLSRGIRVITPDPQGRKEVDGVIMKELACNVFREESRSAVVKEIAALTAKGADAVVMGCTELPLLIRDADSPARLLNTTAIHARAAVKFATG